MPDGHSTAAAPNTVPSASQTAFGARRFGRVNWIGVWTLYKKEVRRYMKVAFQTIVAPIVTTLLYLTVFLVAFSGSDRNPLMEGEVIAYAAFLPPGLIMMAILGNAFQNSSSSLLIGKVQGSVIDLLMPPLSASELTAAIVAGAATRGLMVGGVTALTVGLFMAFGDTPLAISNIFVVVYFAILGSVLLAAVGTITGMWAEKFDQLALVANFLITPLTFLSGTFYSVKKDGLPEWVEAVSAFNPLFYLIDGFRSGFIGVGDTNVFKGAIVCLALSLAMVGLTYVLFKRGYKLKA